MIPAERARPHRWSLLIATVALALALVACADRAGKQPAAADVNPTATAESEAVAPTQPAEGAVAQGETSAPAPSPAATDASKVVGQAYRELIGRLFREVQPSELLTAGWKGVGDEAKREGLTAVDAVKPFSDAGSGDIDSFLREFTLFVSGPGAMLNADKLAQSAIRGMTTAVGDSHTRYLTPQQSEIQDSAADGSYSGIGVVTRLEVTGPVIQEVYAGSPAEQAGLRPGDRIIRVNGNEVAGREQAEVSRQIRGDAGTTVNLTVVGADGESREVAVSRAKISPPVITAYMANETVGYLRVSQFPRRSASVDAAGDFEQAILRLQAAGAKAFVLDLRGNPGGDPTTSVDIASNFTQDGPIFVSVNRNGRRTIYQPNKNRLLVNAPVAVLTDGASASGAEVVASALSEYGAGYLIGTRTCGCLSVGQPLRLDDKSEIVVTVQQALTGRYERSLEGQGLDPDEVVRAARGTNTDPQMERAVEYLRSKLQ